MSLEAPLMTVMAMTSVGLWTLRVAVAARGLRMAGAAVAAIEAVVFAMTFTHLVTDLGSPGRLGGYAVGVAAGTALGLIANDRMAPGHTELHLVMSGEPAEVIAHLHDSGWPITWARADGPAGLVTQIWIVVGDQRVEALVADITRLAPDAFWTLQRLREAHPSPPRPAYDQARARRAVS